MTRVFAGIVALCLFTACGGNIAPKPQPQVPVVVQPTTPSAPSLVCPDEPCPQIYKADGVTPMIQINVRGPHPAPPIGLVIDSTPVTIDQWDFCEAVGFGFYPDGTKRGSCPFGVDLTPERISRELWVADGAPVWQMIPSGSKTPTLERVPWNPWQAGCQDCAKLRVCVKRSICSEWIDAPK